VVKRTGKTANDGGALFRDPRAEDGDLTPVPTGNAPAATATATEGDRARLVQRAALLTAELSQARAEIKRHEAQIAANDEVTGKMLARVADLEARTRSAEKRATDAEAAARVQARATKGGERASSRPPPIPSEPPETVPAVKAAALRTLGYDGAASGPKPPAPAEPSAPPAGRPSSMPPRRGPSAPPEPPSAPPPLPPPAAAPRSTSSIPPPIRTPTLQGQPLPPELLALRATRPDGKALVPAAGGAEAGAAVQLEAVRAEVARAAAKVKEAEDRAKEQGARAEQLDATLAKARAELHAVTRQLETEQRDAVRLRQEVENGRQELERARRAPPEADPVHAELSERAEAAEAALAAAIARERALQKELSFETVKAAQRDKAEAALAEANERVQALEGAAKGEGELVARLRRELAQAVSERERERVAKKTADQTLSRLVDERNALDARLAETAAALEAMRAEREELASEVITLHGELGAARGRAASVREQIRGTIETVTTSLIEELTKQEQETAKLVRAGLLKVAGRVVDEIVELDHALASAIEPLSQRGVVRIEEGEPVEIAVDEGAAPFDRSAFSDELDAAAGEAPAPFEPSAFSGK
jgi:DNA repair exonuclease SbcCD ATPase subunit